MSNALTEWILLGIAVCALVTALVFVFRDGIAVRRERRRLDRGHFAGRAPCRHRRRARPSRSRALLRILNLRRSDDHI